MSSFRDKYKKPLERTGPMREAERLQPVSPQRKFSQGQGKVPPSQRLHTFFVICYWLVPIVVLLSIIVGGILIAIKMGPEPGDPEERENYRPSYQSNFTTLSSMGQAQLLEAYVQAMGGRDVLMEIRSVRFEGTHKDENRERKFQLIVSLPDKGALVFDPGTESSDRFILNGQTAWRVVENDQQERKIQRLDKARTQGMIRTCKLHDPLRELALGGKGVILYIVETEYDGVDSLKVTKERVDGTIIECYLDRETLYLLATEDSYYSDGERRERRVVYGDYRMTSGVVEPFQTATYINDELLNETFLNSIRINPGVMSSLFEVPEELLN